ncbi:AAA family ATPase [Yinghuangia sp. ASG 101]|uniref:AAA family ATPase n=1 Tax=Yinghuangia sp. ASG 101 TaxID=2896848 RepID=UPI001E648C1B|nr:AAA family ATPase [Yinghuangia sp. ASG 101]UGQ10457.1 AAA family ATPase [Yinghuangia sp. ASG 101]
MHLNSMSVAGFRCLGEVRGIPISGPTILAGQNDGGKSAVVHALAFLLGAYHLIDDDRTYLTVPGEAAASKRCDETWVQGEFTLDEWEQAAFNLPHELAVRRYITGDADPVWQCLLPVPNDERLRGDLSKLVVGQLKDLVNDLELSPASLKKPDLIDALSTYAKANSGDPGWVGLPASVAKRLPRILAFDGRDTTPDKAVRTALSGRYEAHMADEALQGKLREIEDEVQDLLRVDAKSLVDHIRSRCPDLAHVEVNPDVSFKSGLVGTPIRIAKVSGEPVGLDRSGLGSSRRVLLAVWEWNNELLVDDGAVQPNVDDLSEADAPEPPVQTIVVYDEPDTHLDYGHQRKIMRLIRDQSSVPNVRVVVATHSMNLIDGVDIDDVVHLKLVDDRTVVERLGADTHDETDGHLARIAASVGLRNTVLLHERCFLAVEGETEQQAFPALFRMATGLSLQAAGIALWACGNNEGALHLARYLVKHKRSVALVVDADSQNLSLFKVDRLKQMLGAEYSKIVKYVGIENQAAELEELFESTVWAKVANKIWPKDVAWEAADFDGLRGSGKFSSRVQQLLQNASLQGPGGKPQMMSDLAGALDGPEDIPEELRDIFDALRVLADG